MDEKEFFRIYSSSGNSMDEKEFFRMYSAMDEEEHLDALHVAIRSNNKEIIKLIIEAGIEINQLSLKGFLTPLSHAVKHADFETVKLLVEAGGDPNFCDNEGKNPPLHVACWQGRLDILKYLLNVGGQLSLSSNDGDTLLSAATCGGNLETVRYLIEKAGFDPHARKDNNNYPLDNPLRSAFECSSSGNNDVIEYLIKKVNLDINEQDAYGNTILMNAVSSSYEDSNLNMVKNILSKGAKIGIRKKESLTLKTAYHYCDKKRNPALMAFLDNVYGDYPEYMA